MLLIALALQAFVAPLECGRGPERLVMGLRQKQEARRQRDNSLMAHGRLHEEEQPRRLLLRVDEVPAFRIAGSANSVEQLGALRGYHFCPSLGHWPEDSGAARGSSGRSAAVRGAQTDCTLTQELPNRA